MNDVRLYLGDCLDVMRTLPDACVDAVVTDPPYNVGCKYSLYDDNLSDAAYEEWCSAWFAECRRVSRVTVIFPGHGNLGMWHRIGKPSGVGCWFKPGNPARGGVFQFCEWEPFLLYGGLASKSDVIRATITKQKDTGDHPCPKPLPLMIELIKRLRNVESILDPFLGSGTTGVACIHTERRFIGIERDPAYFAVAERRINDARAATALFDKAS